MLRDYKLYFPLLITRNLNKLEGLEKPFSLSLTPEFTFVRPSRFVMRKLIVKCVRIKRASITYKYLNNPTAIRYKNSNML